MLKLATHPPRAMAAYVFPPDCIRALVGASKIDHREVRLRVIEDITADMVRRGLCRPMHDTSVRDAQVARGLIGGQA